MRRRGLAKMSCYMWIFCNRTPHPVIWAPGGQDRWIWIGGSKVPALNDRKFWDLDPFFSLDLNGGSRSERRIATQVCAESRFPIKVVFQGCRKGHSFEVSSVECWILSKSELPNQMAGEKQEILRAYPVTEGRPAKFFLLHLLPPDLDRTLVNLSPLHLSRHPDRSYLQMARLEITRSYQVGAICAGRS